MASQELALYFCNEYSQAWWTVSKENAHVGLPSSIRENFFEEIDPIISELNASRQYKSLFKIKSLLKATESR